MTSNKIACVASNDNSANIYETIDALVKAGYKDTFIQWYDKDWEISQEKQLEYMRKNGLNVLFAHLGYQKINTIWQDGEDGDQLVERYIHDLDDMKKNDISLVVMHLTSKSVAPECDETGLSRIRKICEYAKILGIKVAFENTKIKGYLEYVIENIKDDNVGICFDAGHCHAHFNDEFPFEKFKDRIFAVHLHDNHGEKDEHLLPFDGTINWSSYLTSLKENGYNGPLTMELCYRGEYEKKSLYDFYLEGYERAIKLSEIIDGK